MRRSRVQGLTKLGSISEIVCYVASSNYAKFRAFITKVNNSAIFWTITAVLKCKRAVLKFSGDHFCFSVYTGVMRSFTYQKPPQHNTVDSKFFSESQYLVHMLYEGEHLKIKRTPACFVVL